MVRALLPLLISGSTVLGGTVRFFPASVTVDPSNDPTSKLDVAVEAALEGISILALQFSSDTVQFDSFYISDVFNVNCGFVGCKMPGPGEYDNELVVSYWLYVPRYEMPYLAGSLTVSVQDLPPGNHSVLAQGHVRDAERIGQELLEGSVVITVIPQPATLLLLGLGLGAVVRPRRMVSRVAG